MFWFLLFEREYLHLFFVFYDIKLGFWKVVNKKIKYDQINQ